MNDPTHEDCKPDAESYRVKLLLEEGEREMDVAAGEYILDAANAHGIALPAICRQGRCVTCAGRLIGTGEFNQRDADMYFPEDRAAGFVLLCTAKACSDLTIQTNQQDEMRSHRQALGLPAPYG
jgi:ferredoxin